jgi:L-alanine-DL-glutamate epimerase-like enolase superfamily enzyme
MEAKIEKSGNTDFNPKQDSRRDFIKKAALGATGMGLLFNDTETGGVAEALNPASGFSQATPAGKIIITDLKCAIIGSYVVVRIATNVGISGYGQTDGSGIYLKPFVLFYKDYIVGMDPTDVERVMLKIRRLGGFKPWGNGVSAIEMALWDVAGKVAGLPVYKLLGGKIRDHVRAYGRARSGGGEPGAMGKAIRESAEGFTIVKGTIGFHGRMESTVPDFFYGQLNTPMRQPSGAGKSAYDSPAQSTRSGGQQPAAGVQQSMSKNAPYPNRGLITEKGMKAMIDAVEKMKISLGDEVGLALDVGPGMMLSDAIRLARALEPYNLLWLEDMLTGDYYPYVMADLYRELTQSTSTPIHTGEQIYLRQNFRELIETNAVNVLGPDPADMGGIAEMKWVAEYADLHGIQIAPHGVFDGVFGLAAQVQAGAAMPENYIAFEYPMINPQWWFEITEGLPDPIIKNGLIEVWDRPGLGVDFIVKEARKYLREEDKDFFD